MTSSIPMFIPVPVLEKSLYFQNCLTDATGFLDKIKDKNLLNNWENCNPDSKDCFDIKLNHERNNLYKKNIIFENEKDIKKLYLLNSFKMAFSLSIENFCKIFDLKYNLSNNFILYRQETSSIFDNKLIDVKDYTAILFLNQNLNSTPTVVYDNENYQNIFPMSGSVLILRPGIQYQIGNFMDSDRFYAVYNFKADII